MWGGIWRVRRGSFGLSALVCWSACRASTMGRKGDEMTKQDAVTRASLKRKNVMWGVTLLFSLLHSGHICQQDHESEGKGLFWPKNKTVGTEQSGEGLWLDLFYFWMCVEYVCCGGGGSRSEHGGDLSVQPWFPKAKSVKPALGGGVGQW